MKNEDSFDVKENRDRYREYTKKSYQKNKEKYKLQARIYRNYQPLWAKDNLKKSNKIIIKQLQIL